MTAQRTYSIHELHIIIAQNAEEILQLHDALGSLQQENVLLRKENAILRTPTMVYQQCFASGDDTGALWQLENDRCGAKIRATEESIVQNGAELAMLKVRYDQLNVQCEMSRNEVKELRDKIREITDVSTQQEKAIRNLVAKCESKDQQLEEWSLKGESSSHVVRELEAVVKRLRDRLTTEEERSSILQLDIARLRDMTKDSTSNDVAARSAVEELRELQEKHRQLQQKYDNVRIRTVQLEMETLTSRGGRAEHQSMTTSRPAEPQRQPDATPGEELTPSNESEHSLRVGRNLLYSDALTPFTPL